MRHPCTALGRILISGVTLSTRQCQLVRRLQGVAVVTSVLDRRLAWSFPQSVRNLDQHCVREAAARRSSQRVPFVLLASLRTLHDITAFLRPGQVVSLCGLAFPIFPLPSAHKLPMLNMVALVLSIVHALELLMCPMIGNHRVCDGVWLN